MGIMYLQCSINPSNRRYVFARLDYFEDIHWGGYGLNTFHMRASESFWLVPGTFEEDL